MRKTIDEYQLLANAIVLQAVRDYRHALKTLAAHPEDSKAAGMRFDCERFFRSRWATCLTQVDLEEVMEQLQQEAERKYGKPEPVEPEEAENAAQTLKDAPAAKAEPRKTHGRRSPEVA